MSSYIPNALDCRSFTLSSWVKWIHHSHQLLCLVFSPPGEAWPLLSWRVGGQRWYGGYSLPSDYQCAPGEHGRDITITCSGDQTSQTLSGRMAASSRSSPKGMQLQWRANMMCVFSGSVYLFAGSEQRSCWFEVPYLSCPRWCWTPGLEIQVVSHGNSRHRLW